MYHLIEEDNNMKRVLRNIYCGISGKQGTDGKYTFSVDFDENTENDVIKFLEPYFYESDIDENVYWFGYKFSLAARDRRYRDACIDFLKYVQWPPDLDEDNEFDDIEYSPDNITGQDLTRMVRRSLDSIDINRYSIDTMVYPVSSSNNLVRSLVSAAMSVLKNSSSLNYVEVVKADTSNIRLNIERCLADKEAGKLQDCSNVVNREYLENLIQKIRSSDSFSLRRDVTPMSLRPYISNFVEIIKTSANLETSANILIVDDFKSSGTTIEEIIKIIRTYNSEANIYVFTLIGK